MLERPFQGLHFSSAQKNLGPSAFLEGGPGKEFLDVNILVPSLGDIWDTRAMIPVTRLVKHTPGEDLTEHLEYWPQLAAKQLKSLVSSTPHSLSPSPALCPLPFSSYWAFITNFLDYCPSPAFLALTLLVSSIQDLFESQPHHSHLLQAFTPTPASQGGAKKQEVP